MRRRRNQVRVVEGNETIERGRHRLLSRGARRLAERRRARVGSRTPGVNATEGRGRGWNEKKARATGRVGRGCRRWNGTGAGKGARVYGTHDEGGARGAQKREGERWGGVVYIHRAEGGEGPAREFPVFAQPHIDPTPANSLVLQREVGRWGQRGYGPAGWFVGSVQRRTGRARVSERARDEESEESQNPRARTEGGPARAIHRE